MVTRAYEAMNEADREIFQTLIMDSGYTGGYLASILNAAGYKAVDRLAVDHFRRKLRNGKATL